ncbi:MAG: YjjW family glycine radical enzyme activase [Clostridiales bacterium]|mgnify:CR=1 FL=1|nr:YjjW family glycine radical enzyme activase [Clostridiales bacterium]
MLRGLVNKIIPFSSVDGPGNRTAIFLQGCNFNCLYCHNPETINLCNNCGTCTKVCPTQCLTMENGIVHWDKEKCIECDNCLKACKNCSCPRTTYMTVEEVIKAIENTRPFISGITLSGGECMLQKEFVIELFEEVKKLGLTAFIDSNGSIPFYGDDRLMKAIDAVMLDVKSYDKEEHKMLTGQDNEIVFKNMEYLASINKLYEIRTVIVPDILNNEKNVDSISKRLSELNPSIKYKLIKYRPIGVRTEIIKSSMPSEDMMEKLKSIAIKNGCKDVIVV